MDKKEVKKQLEKISVAYLSINEAVLDLIQALESESADEKPAKGKGAKKSKAKPKGKGKGKKSKDADDDLGLDLDLDGADESEDESEDGADSDLDFDIDEDEPEEDDLEEERAELRKLLTKIAKTKKSGKTLAFKILKNFKAKTVDDMDEKTLKKATTVAKNQLK